MTSRIKMLFFAGSARSGSFNKSLAKLGYEIAHANGLSATFADLKDYPMPLYDGDLEAASGPPDAAVKFKALLRAHQAIFIVTPEYNSGITPLLKNTLDWVSRVKSDGEAPLQVFQSRVFALSSASPGGYGGMRSLLMTRSVLTQGLGALVIPEQIAIPKAQDAFDAHGHLADKGLQERFKGIIIKLAQTAARLHV